MKNQPPAVLPDFERMFGTAASARIEGSAPSRSSRIRSGIPRIAAVALVVAAFTGTALAATGVWNPSIGDQANTPPPAVSTSPVPAAMAETVGVFRRAPDAQDHGPAVEATLSTLGSQSADGIRPNSVRYLGANANGEATILLSAERSVFTSGDSTRFFGSGEPACVVVPGAGEAGEAVPWCFGLDQILAGEAAMDVERIDDPSGEVWGLVPDGVASVTTRVGDGSMHQLPVTDNHFMYGWGNRQADPTNGEASRVALVGPFKDFVWRDADGNVVPQQPAG